MHGNTDFWDEPEGNWKDFRWCPGCGTEPLTGDHEVCVSCAATRREAAKRETEDRIRRVRHLIHVWCVEVGIPRKR